MHSSPPSSPAPKQFSPFQLKLGAYLDKHYYNIQNWRPLAAHYTSVRTAQQILKSQRIWLTNPRCSNDRQEIDAAYQAAENAVRVVAPAALADPVIWRLTHAGFQHFVLSLTTFDKLDHADNINLWQTYGDDGRGVALIFDTNKMFAEYSAGGSGRYLFSNVIYDINKLTALVTGMVQHVLPDWIAADAPTKLVYEETLGAAIQNSCAFFKNPCFQYENELRILRTDPAPPVIQFHDNGTFLAPFIEAPVSTYVGGLDQLGLSTGSMRYCMVGPSSDQLQIGAAIATTLVAVGHADPRLSLTYSHMPYRSRGGR